ncbi:TIGR03016 family PEP-CTERM system-associated outer membrane protein [Oleidesulfovibrio alaskensis]|jgi:hypothetical protein
MKYFFRLLVAVMLSLPLCAQAAEIDLKAGIGAGGEYNDNVDERAGGRGDFITHVKPTLGATYEGGRVTGSLLYSGDYQYYKDGTYEDDYNHKLAAQVLVNAVEDFFYISLTDTYSSVYSDARRGEVIEGDETSSSGTVDKNVATLSPYFVLNPDERTQINTGYRLRDVRYAQKDDGTNKISHELFADANREISERLSGLAGYSFTVENAEEDEGSSDDLTRHRVYVGGTYDYAEDSRISLRFGPSFNEYDKGGSAVEMYYEASLVHTFGSVVGTLGFVQDYQDDPDSGELLLTSTYSAGLTKIFDRATLSLNMQYRESEEAEDSAGDGQDSGSGTTRSWRPSLRGTYELSPRATLGGGLTYESEDAPDGVTDRWYCDASLSYAMQENVTASLTYRYKSVDEAGENPWAANRIMAEVGVTF